MALEHETDAILRILTERTIGEDAFCRFDALMQADVPPGIKSFFRAEIRRRLEEDLKKSSWFTGIRDSDAGAARVAQTLLISLTDAYQFTRQEFLDTLDLAVHFVANYLCRPQWTLENFLFDRAPQISLPELAQGLTYFADYRYLGDLALRSLQRRGLHEVGRDEFRALVAKIDDEVVRRHNARELASLPRPLFAFFQLAGSQPDGSIPIDALLVFFDDKKLRVQKEYVRGICHLRNRTHVTMQELAQLTEDLFAGKTVAATQAEPPAVETPPAPAAEIPAAVPDTEIPIPPPPRPRTASMGEPSKTNIALSLTFAGLQGNVVAHPVLPDITALIQPEQRDRFITHVFKGDAARYAGALVMLGSLKTWKDAEAYLDELYRMNNLDPHAGEAAEFSEAVRKRYAITERVP